MTELARRVYLEVPVQVAYDQWTQFEDFPRFMEGVQEVRQLDDAHLSWSAWIAGRPLRWTAEITRQDPDHEIAWRSTDGPANQGRVRFEALAPDRTRVTLQLHYEPRGVLQSALSALGVVTTLVDHNLERYKRFLEERGHATGAWRGAIAGEHAGLALAG